MKLIFCIIGISLIAGQVYCFDVEKFLKPFIEACNKELGLPEKDEPDLKDPKYRCFVACFFKKLTLMENGKIDEKTFMETMEKEYPKADDTQKSKLKECATKANEEKDECEVPIVVVKCVEDLGLPKE